MDFLLSKIKGILGISPGANTLSRRTLKFGVILYGNIWMYMI
jgi:hypothetical protein